MTDTITVEEYRRLVKRQPKYRNTRVDGFDSQAEAKRYDELLLLERAGTISGLVVHPIYELQAAFRDAQGRRWAAVRYEGDFGYTEGGRAVVEDVKGVRTEAFKIKERLFRYRYPEIDLRIVEVRGER